MPSNQEHSHITDVSLSSKPLYNPKDICNVLGKLMKISLVTN